MKTIKIIDLLNMISKGEEVPNKILYKYQHKDFYEEYRLKWNKKYKAYYTTKDNTPITHLLADNLWNLNDEIEILEEEKKIPKKLKLSDYEEVQSQFELDVISRINKILDYLEEIE